MALLRINWRAALTPRRGFSLSPHVAAAPPAFISGTTKLTARRAAPPSSTDAGFKLDNFIASSDDDLLPLPRRPDGRPRTGTTPLQQQKLQQLQKIEQQQKKQQQREQQRELQRQQSSGQEAPSGVASAGAGESRDSGRAGQAQASSPPAIPSATAPPGTFRAIVDADGDVVPLDSDDERSLPFLPAGELSDDSRRTALQRFQYMRRELRATLDDAEKEEFAFAVARELGPAAMGDDWDARTRPDDYAPGEDPLDAGPLPFNIHAVTCTMSLTCSTPNAPRSNRPDRRAVLSCLVWKLGLPRGVADYVRVIAGGHYDARRDALKISVDKHTDAALNKREGFEQLVALCTRSAALLEAHGRLVRPPRFPAYAD